MRCKSSRLFIVYCFCSAQHPFESACDSFRRPPDCRWIHCCCYFWFCRSRSCCFCCSLRFAVLTVAKARNRRVLINRLVQIICKLATTFPFCFYYKIDDVNKNILIPVRFSWDVRSAPAAPHIHHRNTRARARARVPSPSHHRQTRTNWLKMCENKNTAADARQHCAAELRLWLTFSHRSLIACIIFHVLQLFDHISQTFSPYTNRTFYNYIKLFSSQNVCLVWLPHQKRRLLSGNLLFIICARDANRFFSHVTNLEYFRRTTKRNHVNYGNDENTFNLGNQYLAISDEVRREIEPEIVFHPKWVTHFGWMKTGSWRRTQIFCLADRKG